MKTYSGRVVHGRGGASKAFIYADGRRIKEYAAILGFEPYPGSLNVVLDENFNWDGSRILVDTLDVVNRSLGLDSEWDLRPMRFYKLKINGIDAVAYRHIGEKYPRNFLEIIAPIRLRDVLDGDAVTIAREE